MELFVTMFLCIVYKVIFFAVLRMLTTFASQTTIGWEPQSPASLTDFGKTIHR